MYYIRMGGRTGANTARSCVRGRGSERGATLVEFAIILPILVLLTFGIIEFGVAFNADSTVAQSSRAGGRTAAISSLDPAMEYHAIEAAATALNIDAGSVSGTPVVCVGKYNPASTNPCGDYSLSIALAHPTTPDSQVWRVPSTYYADPVQQTYPNDNWPVTSRNFGCNGTFDKVVVHVEIRHKLLVPGIFSTILGSDAPKLTSSSVFNLEPVPSGSCS